jgi:superfamily II DNA/RNA helicase
MPQPTKKYYGSSFSTRRQQPRRSYSQRKTNDRRYKKDYIDPRKFVKVAKITQTETYSPEHSFNDFNVNHLIKQNLLNKGFISPSPIQDKTIAPIIDGKDVIGLADTGTGKTAAFAIPLLDKIMLKNVRLLVIAPTRELAQQIDEEFRWIAKGSNLNSAILIGGTNIGGQLRDLRRQPQIVIGTPGRRSFANLCFFRLL